MRSPLQDVADISGILILRHVLMEVIEPQAALHGFAVVQPADDILHVLVRFVLEGVRHPSKEVCH